MGRSSKVAEVGGHPRETWVGIGLAGIVLGIALGCQSLPSHGPIEESPTVAGRPVDEWCVLLEPDPAARAWLEIPWHTSFHAGLAAADRADRPLLLWLMNGHPLGCT